MGTWAGEPGLARARAADSSRRARSSSPKVSVLTTGGRPGSGTGHPGTIVLLGYHGVQPGLHVGQADALPRAASLAIIREAAEQWKTR
jgi:hypothetical protein